MSTKGEKRKNLKRLSTKQGFDYKDQKLSASPQFLLARSISAEQIKDQEKSLSQSQQDRKSISLEKVGMTYSEERETEEQVRLVSRHHEI